MAAVQEPPSSGHQQGNSTALASNIWTMLLILLGIGVIQVETALLIFTVLRAFFESVAFPVLIPLVFLVVNFALDSAPSISIWRRILFRTPVVAVFPIICLMAGAQMKKQQIIDSYYTHSAEKFARLVADHRLTELTQELTRRGCGPPGNLATAECASLRRKFDEATALGLSSRMASEEPQYYCRRIYEAALKNQCPSHARQFDSQRANDPRMPQRDLVSLLFHTVRDLPSPPSLEAFIYAAILLWLHAALLVLEELLDKIRSARNEKPHSISG